MVEVGIRELKSRLSYYVQLMQAGQVVAIKVRNKIVGFLSNLRPETKKKKGEKNWRPRDLKKKIEQWKTEGILLSGSLCKPRRIQSVTLKGKITTTDLLRKLRDEE